MKLKSLILGSVAAAGLSTAGYAADLGVLTSLDVCDSLGISGLTISSSTNCLKISGNVTYEFNWGDYAGAAWAVNTNDPGPLNVMDNDAVGALDNDWSSDVDAWLKFVGSAASDFGTASATIKLDVGGDPQITVTNEAITGGAAGGDPAVLLDEAFVSVGDSTTIMAGKKGSIANDGNDVPLNFLGLFNSEAVDTGVDTNTDVAVVGDFKPTTGGHVIQVVSTVADGVVLKGGLEALNAAPADAGTLVGVVEYAGNGIKAHVTGMAGGILDGTVETWAAHAGFEGAFDNFSVVGAGAFGANNAGDNYWNVLGSAKATFDIFEIALSGEATGGTTVNEQTGFGGSIGAKVTDDVKLNLGARWFDENTAAANTETIHVAAQIVAAVAQGVTLTGEVGYYGTNEVAAVTQTDLYGLAKLEWKPGGEKNFTSSITGQVHSTGAYKVTFKASKDFE